MRNVRKEKDAGGEGGGEERHMSIAAVRQVASGAPCWVSGVCAEHENMTLWNG